MLERGRDPAGHELRGSSDRERPAGPDHPSRPRRPGGLHPRRGTGGRRPGRVGHGAGTRAELIARTAPLVAEGERLQRNPSLDALRTWLQLSDDLLSAAWGSMDRYHLSWLQVGRPTSIVRGRPMREDEEVAYVREVAAAKTAVLRMSLDAVDRLGMPFVGETRDAGPAEAR